MELHILSDLKCDDDLKRARDYRKKARRKCREEVYTILGDSCVRCGFSDKRALQVDHINGGGLQERKDRGSHSGFALLANVRKYG